MDWVEKHNGKLKDALVFGRNFIDKAENQALKKKEIADVKEERAKRGLK